VADRTGEAIIGTKDGVIKVRDVRSREEGEAWNLGSFNDIRGTPWPIQGRERIKLRSLVIIPAERTAPRQLIEGEDRYFIVRRMRIAKEFIRMVGFTVGRPGCRAVNRGPPAVNHNEECRKRVEGDEKVMRSDERIRERNGERQEKKWHLAGGGDGAPARGGVEDELMNDGNGNGDGGIDGNGNGNGGIVPSSSSDGILQQQQQ